MSLALGLRTAHKIYSLGHKLHTGYTLGKKLGKVGSNLLKVSAPAVPAVAGEGANNMIYNKSNLGEAQYIPLGMKRMVPMKKSYLEKR